MLFTPAMLAEKNRRLASRETPGVETVRRRFLPRFCPKHSCRPHALPGRCGPSPERGYMTEKRRNNNRFSNVTVVAIPPARAKSHSTRPLFSLTNIEPPSPNPIPSLPHENEHPSLSLPDAIRKIGSRDRASRKARLADITRGKYGVTLGCVAADLTRVNPAEAPALVHRSFFGDSTSLRPRVGWAGRVVALISSVAMISNQYAWAATYTWNGPAANWSTSANWTGGNIGSGQGNIVNINVSGANGPTLDTTSGNVTIGALDFTPTGGSGASTTISAGTGPYHFVMNGTGLTAVNNPFGATLANPTTPPLPMPRKQLGRLHCQPRPLDEDEPGLGVSASSVVCMLIIRWQVASITTLESP